MSDWPRRDTRLDERIAALGFNPGRGLHVAGCGVGIVPRARCTCDAIVAARENRRRRERRRLLTR